MKHTDGFIGNWADTVYIKECNRNGSKTGTWTSLIGNPNYEFVLTFSFSYYVVVFVPWLRNVVQQRVPTALHAGKETQLSVQREN
jgi:hypothetical protein